jgi:hypothetical protein
MTEATLSRRTFIHRVGVWTALAASSGLALQACGGDSGGDEKSAASVKCDDVTALDDAQKAQRTALGYVEASVQEGKNCTNCQQNVPAADPAACGTCKVVPGPINPAGYCNVWVQKTA